MVDRQHRRGDLGEQCRLGHSNSKEVAGKYLGSLVIGDVSDENYAT